MIERPDAHINDAAELYALGALDAAQIRAIDAHAATCAACRRRLGEAEEAVLAIDRAYVEVPPPATLAQRIRASRHRSARRGPSWYALAAACVVALLPALVLFAMLLQARHTQNAHAAAELAMIHSHFAHAQFAPVPGAHAPRAKVVFAKDGAWLYVIVDEPRAYAVSADARGTRTTLGETNAYGGVSELFVAHPPRGVTAVYLADGAGHDVARAATLAAPR